MVKEEKELSLSDSLKRLETITQWFEEQEEVDVEKALEKVKEGALLLRKSKARLKEVENEFKLVHQELQQDE